MDLKIRDMKRILQYFILCFLLSCCDNISFDYLFKPEIKISDLFEKQSEYANSIVHLNKLKVIQCSGIFSFQVAEVTDGKCAILLFSTKPYSINEIVDVKARYKVMFNYNGQTISALVTDDFPLRQYLQMLQ